MLGVINNILNFAKVEAGHVDFQIEEVPVDLDGGRRVGESKMKLLPTLAGYWRLFRAGRAEA